MVKLRHRPQLPQGRVLQLARSAGTDSGLAHTLGTDLDLDLLADEHAAGLERLVPRDAELFAVDLGGRAEPDDLLAPRALRVPLELDVELDLAGDVANRQVADE